MKILSGSGSGRGMKMTNLADHPIGAVFPWQDGEETVMLKVDNADHTAGMVCRYCHFLESTHADADKICDACDRENGDRVFYSIHNPKDTE